MLAIYTLSLPTDRQGMRIHCCLLAYISLLA